MSGETDLQTLLRSMSPVLALEPFGFMSVTHAQAGAAKHPFAVINEDEGVTLVATVQALEELGLVDIEKWARITLQIHSSLQAVGLTAAFAAALGKVGISANVIAGFHHDHILVQWERRHDAMSALQELSNQK